MDDVCIYNTVTLFSSSCLGQILQGKRKQKFVFIYILQTGGCAWSHWIKNPCYLRVQKPKKCLFILFWGCIPQNKTKTLIKESVSAHIWFSVEYYLRVTTQLYWKKGNVQKQEIWLWELISLYSFRLAYKENKSMFIAELAEHHG